MLDNLSAGQLELDLPKDVEVVSGDYTDEETLAACLRGVDAVVHLAALSGVIDLVEDPRPSFDINVKGSFQLLELARRAKVKKLINASTGGALLGEVKPPISEDMAPSPLSPYGASKLAVEGYCSAFAGAYGFPCATLRFSNIYGPRSGHKKSVVAAFIKNILRREPLVVYGDGTQQRDYLYVGDLVVGIEAALKRRAYRRLPIGVRQTYGAQCADRGASAGLWTRFRCSLRGPAQRRGSLRRGAISPRQAGNSAIMLRPILRRGWRRPGLGMWRTRTAGLGNWYYRLRIEGRGPDVGIKMLSKLPGGRPRNTDAELPASVVIPIFNEQSILMPNTEALGELFRQRAGPGQLAVYFCR